MENQDIRWEQRFSNFRKALSKLTEAVHIVMENQKELDEEPDDGKLEIEDEMLKESLIKRFEFTHELAWKVMKDYAEYQGKFDIKGPKDATRDAFSVNIISDGQLWMDMIKSRNLTVHTYNEDTVDEVCNDIVNRYYPAFGGFATKMSELIEGEQQELL